MFNNIPLTIDALLAEAEKEDLYDKLIVQINKDFAMANTVIRFPCTISPLELKNQMEKNLYWLIQYQFSTYLNFLYIVDVSEEQLKERKNSDFTHFLTDLSFLVLKREWQKVWFRNKL